MLLLVLFFRKLKNAGYDVVFLEATRELPMTSQVVVDEKVVEITNGRRENAKAWFVYDPNDPCSTSAAFTDKYINYIGLDQSIDLVRNFIDTFVSKEGEKVALFGFSQGGTFVHLISMLVATLAADDDFVNDYGSNWTNKVGCVICAGAFPAKHRPNEDSEYYHQLSSFNHHDDNLVAKDNDNNKKKIIIKGIPSLHIIGENDTSVVPEKSIELSSLFYETKTYFHPKGHLISQNSASCQTVITFLNNYFV